MKNQPERRRWRARYEIFNNCLWVGYFGTEIEAMIALNKYCESNNIPSLNPQVTKKTFLFIYTIIHPDSMSKCQNIHIYLRYKIIIILVTNHIQMIQYHQMYHYHF